MSIQINSYVRNVLALDAVTSGLAGIAMIAGAGFISGLTALPSGLLFWAGVVLMPWTAVLLYFSRRSSMSRFAMIDIVAVNALWVVASVGILVTGAVTPNMLGVAFVIAQAAAVLLFTVLQMGVLRASAQPA